MAKPRRTPAPDGALDAGTANVIVLAPAAKAAAKPRTRSKAAATPAKAATRKPATEAPAAKPRRPTRRTIADSVPVEQPPAPKAKAPAKPRRKPVVANKPARPMLLEDQPLGQAAQEIARIRDGMTQIRQMIDGNPLPDEDARTLLARLCRTPVPAALVRARSAGGSASVIDLMPRANAVARIATLRQIAAPEPQPQTEPAVAPDPVPQPMAMRAPSRLRRLFSAWGDWLMWRLMPPPRPAAVPVAAPSVPVVAPVPAARADVPAPLALDQIVAQAISRVVGDGSLRDHLQEMIREELEGEMGARFSGNLRAVIRREIATGLDDRLTHL